MKNLGIILVFILIISLALFFTIYDSNRNSKLREEYKNVTKSDCFFGIITDLHINKGISYIIVNSKEKFLLDISQNKSYDGVNAYLSQMLTIGDSLVKKNRTDSLIVYKEDKVYYFRLGEIIEKRK